MLISYFKLRLQRAYLYITSFTQNFNPWFTISIAFYCYFRRAIFLRAYVFPSPDEYYSVISSVTLPMVIISQQFILRNANILFLAVCFRIPFHTEACSNLNLVTLKVLVSKTLKNFLQHEHHSRKCNQKFHYIHTYSQDYDLASHTTYVVCVIFIHEWRYLHIKADSKRNIFEKLFMAFFFYSQNFFQKSPREHF